MADVDFLALFVRSFRWVLTRPGFILLYLLPLVVLGVVFGGLALSFLSLLPGETPAVLPEQEVFRLLGHVQELLPVLAMGFILYLAALLLAQGAAARRAGALESALEMTPSEALAGALPSLPRLFGATLLYILAVAGVVALVMTPALLLLSASMPVFTAASLASGPRPGSIPSGAVLLLVVIPLLVAAIPAIYLAVRLSLYVPACVLENIGPLASLKRSWGLSRGRFGRLLLLLAFYVIPGVVIRQAMPVGGLLLNALLFGPAAGVGTSLFFLEARRVGSPAVPAVLPPPGPPVPS